MAERISVGQPSIGDREIDAVLAMMLSGRLTQGKGVARFEAEFGELVRAKHVVACSSGTTALHLALVALGIGAGDEVLVPDLSFVATANAVSYTGATPVLVDVDPTTWNISSADVASKISFKTKAIIPVHLYGVPCDMDALRALAVEYNLEIIEDAAEGLGGHWKGEPLGSIGICGAFSFYANKILTTGEGGAVVTDDDTLAETLRYYRGQAMSTERRFWHSEIGFNYRMTDIAAAIGIAQLSRFEDFLQKRTQIVQWYREFLEGVVLSPDVPGTAPWLFTGLLPEGISFDRAERCLEAEGIETRPVFIPMHNLPMYARPVSQFPNAARIANRGISLPTHPDLIEADVRRISKILKELL